MAQEELPASRIDVLAPASLPDCLKAAALEVEGESPLTRSCQVKRLLTVTDTIEGESPLTRSSCR